MSLQKIKLSNGKVKEIQSHLAFDTSLQKQQGFVPCDDKGVPISSHATEEKKTAKQTNVHAAAEPVGKNERT